MNPKSRIPLWFKLAYLAFVAAMVPLYLWHYGAASFLWLSNIAVLAGLMAVWTESPRLASMMLVSVLLPDLAWTVSFLTGLALDGKPPLGLTAYMFDASIPLFLRALSLYHVALPPVLLWLVWRLGYDRIAWRIWIPIGWTILLITWWVAPPEENINLVTVPAQTSLAQIPTALWMASLIAGSGLVWWGRTSFWTAWSSLGL